MDQEIIIGKNPVIEALTSGRAVNKVLILEHLNAGAQAKLNQLAKEAGTIVQKVPKSKLDQLSDGNHQGVIAYVAAYEYATLDDLFANAADKGEDPFFIILDELEDPHNLGSIFHNSGCDSGTRSDYT